MKLWDIKGNALRLMFADSDLQFSRDEFENGVLQNNGNTRDKLIRMNDSIRRGIDLYYQYCSQVNKKAKVKYKEEEEEGGAVYAILDLDDVKDFGFPTRIELLYNSKHNILPQENLEYYFDEFDKEVSVVFTHMRYHDYDILRDLEFVLFYKMDNKNLPSDKLIDDLDFDLNEIGLPEEIQRVLPLYIKGELYEEDEFSIAKTSRNEFLEFLVTYRKKFSTVQNKVNSKFRRG